MSGHWRDSRLQRRFVLGFYVALALAVLAATATVIVAVSSSSAKLADRLAEAGDVLAGGTLLLAAIAALVALHAYANVTGLPDLKFKMQFPFSECNQPTFETSAGEYGWRAEPFEQPHMTISLHNASGYSARNPAVIVRLKAMRFNKSGDWPRDTDWAVIDFATVVTDMTPEGGATAVQWDGGPNYSIHGRSVRRLPMFDFGLLISTPEWGEPSFKVELLAEGYRRELTIPVGFTIDGKSQFPGQGSERSPDWI